jgi:hypothetical protein
MASCRGWGCSRVGGGGGGGGERDGRTTVVVGIDDIDSRYLGGLLPQYVWASGDAFGARERGLRSILPEELHGEGRRC